MDRAYKTEWQRNYRRKFQEKYGFSSTANYGNGKIRLQILERDNFACVKCGMTDAEHKARWNRPITVDHKDKNRKNNAPENLQTLCLPCHGAKDLLPELKAKKGLESKLEIRAMRLSGWSYRRIAEVLSLGISTVWKLNKQQEQEETNV